MEITGPIKSVEFKTEEGIHYKMELNKDSVYYYKNEELVTVREVGLDYDTNELYKLGSNIAEKYNVPQGRIKITYSK